jgi:hypothetical protein
MEDGSVKLIKGCGIGCAVVFGVLILLIVIGYYKVKGKLDEFKEFEDLSLVIDEKFGKVDDYMPPFEPGKFSERIQRFISVRKELQPDIKKLERELLDFEGNIKNSGKSFWDKLDILSSGLGIIPGMLNFYKVRNDVLIKYEMGFGEYYHHYIICCYSFLQKSPGDGPKFNISENISITYKDDDEVGSLDSTVYEVREETFRKLSNKYFRIFYGNLISVRDRVIDAGVINMIEGERLKLNDKKYRLPWEEGLPELYLDILVGRKSELDSLYSALVNPVEMNKISE